MMTTTERILSKKFDPTKEPPKIEPILEIFSAGKWHPVCRRFSFGGIVGRMKSRKSLVASYITASILKKDRVNIFRCLVDLPPDALIVYIDTEQSDTDFWIVQNRILKLSGLEKMPDNYIAIPAIGESKADIRLFINDFLDTHIRDGKHIGALIVDGLVDICDDYMSNKESEAAVNLLHGYSNNIDMVMTVLHLNKDGKETRGSLGTQFDNKCSFQIKVDKKMEDDPISRISAKLTRGLPGFPPTDIIQGFDGLLKECQYLTNDWNDEDDDITFNNEGDKDSDLPF